MDDPEQRLSEALRARATQTGGRPPAPQPPPFPGFHPGQPPGQAPGQIARTGASRARVAEPPRTPLTQIGWALLIALLAGAVLGCALGLLSVLVPGLLPPLG